MWKQLALIAHRLSTDAQRSFQFSVSVVVLRGERYEHDEDPEQHLRQGVQAEPAVKALIAERSYEPSERCLLRRRRVVERCTTRETEGRAPRSRGTAAAPPRTRVD
jgi:hypothetical protein